MLVFPISVDVPMARLPTGNWALLAVTIAVSALALQHPALREVLVLRAPPSLGWLGHMLCHADALHLLGNMLFLWVFGNAVCAKLGSGPFLVLYTAFGLFAALAHVAFDGRPAAGASGAISGVTGLFAALFPRNATRLAWVFWIKVGTFEVPAYWPLGTWLLLDVLGAFRGESGTAYLAHVAGFAAGLAFGVVALRRRWIAMARHEQSLLDWLDRRVSRAPRRGGAG